MTEFQELTKDAPKFASMERGELVAYAYAMYAAGAKKDAENAKLRELVRFIMHQCNDGNPRCDECVGWNGGECVALLRMRELEIEEDK